MVEAGVKAWRWEELGARLGARLGGLAGVAGGQRAVYFYEALLSLATVWLGIFQAANCQDNLHFCSQPSTTKQSHKPIQDLTLAFQSNMYN